MELKYIKNQKDITPTLYLYEDIGEISGSRVVQEIKFLESTGNKEIHVRINSSGGSIIDGFSIIGALQNSSMKVTTFNDFLAASMAGLIFLSGGVRKMATHALLMIHDPNMGGTKPNKKQKEVMSKFRDSLLIKLNESTGVEIEKLSELMKNETWLNADESIELFGDKIEIYKPNGDLVLDQLQMIHNSIKYFKNINNIMEKENTNDVVVEETQKVVTEEKVTEVVNEDDNKIEALEEHIQKLTSELKEYKDKEVSNMENKIHTLLEPIKDSISTEDYNTFFKIGKTNLDFVKNSVEKISKPAVIETKDISNAIVKEDHTDELLDISELSRTNPSKLKEIYDNQFELYKRSFEKTYGVDYVE